MKALTLSVVALALQITSGALPDGQVGVPYDTALTASGGAPPYTWTVSNALPQGLSLNASSGAIAGTPTQSGTTTFLVQLADSTKQTKQKSSSIAITSASAALDRYGGREDITCTATGWFHTQKIGSHWWLCTPLGNAFFAESVDGVIYTALSNINVSIKYGSAMPVWTEETNLRLQGWNFNTLGIWGYNGNNPYYIDPSFPLDSHSLHSQPVKMPFFAIIRPAFYSMLNEVISTNTLGNIRLLTNPTKNVLAVHSPFYTNYVYTAIGDYFDSGIGTWMLSDLQNDTQWNWFNTGSPSPYVNYLIGMEVEDGDEMAGFTISPAFATDPPGKGNLHLGMMVATMSPLQTANSNVENISIGWVYTNTQIYSKLALEAALKTEYGTVGALNTAWGSSYTTFDSSGVCVGSQPITCASSVSADSVGTGNGSTLTFGTTLSHTAVSACSLQILVAGIPVAGDDSKNGFTGGCSASAGVLWGPHSSGTINYSTGVISITFTSGNAPTGAITATYVANGWGIGTGFLDEDNRVSHNSYFGTDWFAMSNAATNVKTDMNTFLNALAVQFFSTSQTELHAVLPNTMYLGPNSLNNWGAPPPAQVLQAAGTYIDAFTTLMGSAQFSQAEMNFIAANYGDKPYFGAYYTCANPDSARSAYSTCTNYGTGSFSTQAARGAAYATQIGNMLQNVPTSAGNFPYIGMEWWSYADVAGSNENWGLVTINDNAYDGHESVTGSVTCSGVLGIANAYGGPYTCGSEPTPVSGGGTPPFGDLITTVTSANHQWLNIQ